MSVVLDSGGVSALARDRSRMSELVARGEWPPEVPAVVLVEALTGDPRRDHATNTILGLCLIRDVTEDLARRGGTLRTATGRAGEISAVDAVVIALAEGRPEPTVLTSDPKDLLRLAAQCGQRIRVLPV